MKKKRNPLEEFLYQKGTIEAYTILMDSQIGEVKKLSPDSKYLFTQSNGKRMTSRSFNYWLEKYCREAEVPFTISHCIQRTFYSRLYAEACR
nr:hypothetical protein [uncultured Lachnoclostridium sp.]